MSVKAVITNRNYNPLWVLLFPAVFLMAVFNLLPMGVSLLLGFMRWDLLASPEWIGLQNYQAVLGSALFYKTLWNTLFFATVSVVLEVGVALILSCALLQITKGQRWLETIYFLPVVTPMVAFALVWQWLLDPSSDGINHVLQALGGTPIAFLSEPGWAMAAIITLRVWKELGLAVLMIWTALKSVPKSLLEASVLDGAAELKQFWYVVLPQLQPILLFVITVSLISALQSFDSVFLLTKGGPDNATQLLVYGVYKHAFEYYRVGQASAMAYLLALIIVGLTLVQWWARRLHHAAAE